MTTRTYNWNELPTDLKPGQVDLKPATGGGWWIVRGPHGAKKRTSANKWPDKELATLYAKISAVLPPATVTPLRRPAVKS